MDGGWGARWIPTPIAAVAALAAALLSLCFAAWTSQCENRKEEEEEEEADDGNEREIFVNRDLVPNILEARSVLSVDVAVQPSFSKYTRATAALPADRLAESVLELAFGPPGRAVLTQPLRRSFFEGGRGRMEGADGAAAIAEEEGSEAKVKLERESDGEEEAGAAAAAASEEGSVTGDVTQGESFGAIWDGGGSKARAPPSRMDGDLMELRTPSLLGDESFDSSYCSAETSIEEAGCSVTTKTVVTRTQESDLDATIRELRALAAGEPATRLRGLLHRDEERRARRNPSIAEGEWERLVRDVLASVSELERCERRDVSAASADRPPSGPHTSTMEEQPPRVKNLRFKLDPDIFDVPSNDDPDEDEEPVRLVSVRTSVVPAGQKLRPLLDIDLRIRVEERKRSHPPPAQVSKRRSPVCLSPVSENTDWPNGILKPRNNPFRGPATTDSKQNGVDAAPKKPDPPINGFRKTPESFPRKKKKSYQPDPEAMERITGYRSALSTCKPPLPPPPATEPARDRPMDGVRKHYFERKAVLASNKTLDGSREFQRFLAQARSDRSRMTAPDPADIESAVARQWAAERTPSPRRDKEGSPTPSPRSSTPDDVWARQVSDFRRRLDRRSASLCYLETDIDAPVLPPPQDKCCSLSALDEPAPALNAEPEPVGDDGRVRSEHELRVERSLRNLSLPDWCGKVPKSGFILARKEEKRGWAAAKSRASSTSSLTSVGQRRPSTVRSLRSSHDDLTRSRASPALSLTLNRAFREPYLGWRARTPSEPSSCETSLPHTDTVSFDGEDVREDSSTERPSPVAEGDTCDDVATLSADTCCDHNGGGEDDTCDDLNGLTMDTSDAPVNGVDHGPSPGDEDVSRGGGDTEDGIDNISTDVSEKTRREKEKRFSYCQSIYNSERPTSPPRQRKQKSPSASEPSPNKVIWIESSFVGARTTTSIVVLPTARDDIPPKDEDLGRPASR